MGWSCSKKANDTLDRLTQFFKEKGEKSSNTFTTPKGSYFWDVNTAREYRDGRITGQVYRFIVPGGDQAQPIGSFTINGEGKIVKFPGLPKEVKKHLNFCVTEAFVVIPN